jgi:hypothetical protein
MCIYEGCERPIHNKANSLCNAHYGQFRRGENLRPVRPRMRPSEVAAVCVEDGCDRKPMAQNKCPMHYYREKRGSEARSELYGQTVTYTAIHQRLYRVRGKAKDHSCACGRQAAGWAMRKDGGHVGTVTYATIQHSRGYELEVPLSDSIEDYDPLCHRCHYERDGGRGGKP